MAPSPRQLLNGQGVRIISGFKPECRGIRFGILNVGSLCGRKTEVCEALRKRRVDVYCEQKVRWKGQAAGFVGTSEPRYKTMVVRKCCRVGKGWNLGERGNI